MRGDHRRSCPQRRPGKQDGDGVLVQAQRPRLVQAETLDQAHGELPLPLVRVPRAIGGSHRHFHTIQGSPIAFFHFLAWHALFQRIQHPLCCLLVDEDRRQGIIAGQQVVHLVHIHVGQRQLEQVHDLAHFALLLRVGGALDQLGERPADVVVDIGKELAT